MPRRTEELLSLAESENVDVDPVNLRNPMILGFYLRHPLLQRPCIGIRADLFRRQCNVFRSVLAEELGHHFTATGSVLRVTTYNDWLLVCRDEWQARRWAADYLCPIPKVLLRLRRGDTPYDLAEWFGVTPELIQFQLERIAPIQPEYAV